MIDEATVTSATGAAPVSLPNLWSQLLAHGVPTLDELELSFVRAVLQRVLHEVLDQLAQRHLGVSRAAARVDADDVPELVALLKAERPALVINVALPFQDLTIMDACLEAGVHYLDTANYEPRDTAKFEYSWQWAYRDNPAGHRISLAVASDSEKPL